MMYVVYEVYDVLYVGQFNKKKKEGDVFQVSGK